MTKPHHSVNRALAGSLAAALAVIGALIYVLPPFFEGNDDVGMSMRAHGYGISETESSRLIFSNVLWGHIVRALPEFGGILGYSLATVAVLALSTWLLLFFLWNRLGVNWLLTGVIAVLIVSRPSVFSQFTINAGLLALVAVIAVVSYGRSPKAGLLAIATISACVAFLIRGDMLIMMMLVATPLFPWRALARSRWALISLVFLVAFASAATLVNRNAYEEPAWKEFQQFNAARIPYTDFGLAYHIASKKPEIAEKYGLSSNDVLMIGGWFFPDPAIVSTETLEGMHKDAGSRLDRAPSARSIVFAYSTLWTYRLVPLVVAAVLLFLLFPSWRGLATWILFLCAIGAIAFLGRPGITRVYFSPIALLVCVPFLVESTKSARAKIREKRDDPEEPPARPIRLARSRMVAAFLVVLGAALWQTNELRVEHKRITKISKEVRGAMTDIVAVGLDKQPLITWGTATLPFSMAYPVLSDSGTFERLKIYSLSSSTRAPGSVARSEDARGNNITDQLRSAEGANMLFWQRRKTKAISYLETYCDERENTNLRVNQLLASNGILILNVKCADQ